MDNKYPVYMLNIQYRYESLPVDDMPSSHPFISFFPSQFFYQGKLQNSKHVQQKHYHKVYHDNPLYYPVLFYNVISGKEQNVKKSLMNKEEAEFALNLYTSFLTKYPEERSCKILILTPYKEQKNYMVDLFSTVCRGDVTTTAETAANQAESEPSFPMPIISTVDAFQGQEADIVIFSTVRAGAQTGIGFVNDIHRLNVALTRPKYALWIVGNIRRLKQAVIWSKYYNFCYTYALIRKISDPKVDINGTLYNAMKSQPQIPEQYIPSLDNTPLDANGNTNIKECLVEEKPGTTNTDEAYEYSDGEPNYDLSYRPIYYCGMLKSI